MSSYKIDIDNTEVLKGLRTLANKSPENAKQTLGELAEESITRIKKGKLRGQVLNRRTGKLAQSINYNFNGSYEVTIGSNMKYAAIHEFGGVITGKNGPLTFTIDGNFIQVDRVVMPARPYIQPGIEEILNGPRGKAIIERNLEKYIDRYWGVV